MTDIPGQADDDFSAIDEAAWIPVMPPTKVRVAWIAGKDTIATYGRTLNPLAIGLFDEFVALTVACPQGADLHGLPTPPVEVFTHGRLNWWKLQTGAADILAEQIKSCRVELLHALDMEAAPLTRTLAECLDLPYVASSYGLGDTRRLAASDGRLKAVLAASEPVRRELLSHHPALKDKLLLVHPGVYHEHSATCFLEPNQSIAIVASGSLEHVTAFDAVLKSFAALRDGGYDCAFFLIGNGSGERKLRARAEQLRLRQELTFVDHLPTAQMPEIFKAADIFISPTSEREIDAAALLAMAAGVPVLATDDRPSDFLIDGQTARLFTEGDAGALTAKLTGLLDDPPAARALAEKALTYVEENHSAARMVAAVAQIYRMAAM